MALFYFSDGSFHDLYRGEPEYPHEADDTESEASMRRWSGVNSIGHGGHGGRNHSQSNNVAQGDRNQPIYVCRK